MAQGKKIDMTSGPIMKKIFIFAVPIIMGNILQQLYTTVDTLVISNFCSSTSLAAVGTSAQPVEVMLCIFLGIGAGVSILVSQYTGANDTEGLVRISRTASFFVFATGIPMCILGVLAAPFILKCMGTPADVWDTAVAYTRIVFMGALANIGYNMNAGILRGTGDSKASLWFLVVSCIINIVGDLVFVALFGMDAAGAAFATMIAMYVSWIVSVIYIKKRFPNLNFKFLPGRCDMAELKQIIRTGLPIGLNNSLYSFGHMVLQSIVNAQGTDFMAGVVVAGRITGLTNVAISALSSAATTFSGQNFGAYNYDRLRKGYIKIPLLSGAITLSVGLLIISFRMPILRLFSKDEQVLVYAGRYVFVMLLSQWIFAVFNGMTCIVNGVGLIKYTTLVNLLMLWAVRVPCAYIISGMSYGTYVMFCYPISFSFGMFMMAGYYAFSKKWKKIIYTENLNRMKV